MLIRAEEEFKQAALEQEPENAQQQPIQGEAEDREQAIQNPAKQKAPQEQQAVHEKKVKYVKQNERRGRTKETSRCCIQ